MGFFSPTTFAMTIVKYNYKIQYEINYVFLKL